MNFDIKRRTNAIETIFFNHVINHIIFKTVHTAMKTSAKKKYRRKCMRKFFNLFSIVILNLAHTYII